MDTGRILKYIDDSLPDAERKDVYDWICASEENLKEFKSLRRIYDLTLWRDESAERTSEATSGPSIFPPASRSRASRFAVWAATVCSAACLLVAAVFLRQSRRIEPLASFDSVSAPAGKELKVTLTDGSTVWLNSNSTLRVIKNARRGARRVNLDGEAYFKVAKDSRHPFIVETEKFDVKVLGTEFDVSAYVGKSWTTSLVTGSVSINAKDGKKLTVLSPMTKAVFEGKKLTITGINSDSGLWRDGILFFDNLTIPEIFDKLSIYYNLDIDISEAGNLDKRYTGKFRSVDGYEHILKVLQMDGSFTYEVMPSNGSLVTIKIRKPRL